jgi:hypothetical protein
MIRVIGPAYGKKFVLAAAFRPNVGRRRFNFIRE